MFKKTTDLWVISSVTFSDETRTETGSGGFFWLSPSVSKEVATASFEREVDNFQGDAARIRLVHMSVPSHLDSQGVTDYLEDRLDEIEVHATALKETDTFSVFDATLDEALGSCDADENGECSGACVTRPHVWSPSGARCTRTNCTVVGSGDPCGDGNCEGDD